MAAENTALAERASAAKNRADFASFRARLNVGPFPFGLLRSFRQPAKRGKLLNRVDFLLAGCGKTLFLITNGKGTKFTRAVKSLKQTRALALEARFAGYLGVFPQPPRSHFPNVTSALPYLDVPLWTHTVPGYGCSGGPSDAEKA